MPPTNPRATRLLSKMSQNDLVVLSGGWSTHTLPIRDPRVEVIVEECELHGDRLQPRGAQYGNPAPGFDPGATCAESHFELTYTPTNLSTVKRQSYRRFGVMGFLVRFSKFMVRLFDQGVLSNCIHRLIWPHSWKHRYTGCIRLRQSSVYKIHWVYGFVKVYKPFLNLLEVRWVDSI